MKMKKNCKRDFIAVGVFVGILALITACGNTGKLDSNKEYKPEYRSYEFNDLNYKAVYNLKTFMEMQGQPMNAERFFDFTYALSGKETGSENDHLVSITLENIDAKMITALGQQKFDTRHINGKSFDMIISAVGSKLSYPHPDQLLRLDMGAMAGGVLNLEFILKYNFPGLPDTPLKDGETWTETSQRTTGFFVPPAQFGDKTIEKEPVFFEVVEGNEIPLDWIDCNSGGCADRIVDVRLIDKDGRTLASVDGGPTHHTDPWVDPLSIGLVNTADLMDTAFNDAPRNEGSPVEVQNLESARVQSGTLDAPTLSVEALVASDLPEFDGVSTGALEAIWQLGRAMSREMRRPLPPESLDKIAAEFADGAERETTTRSTPLYIWWHRAVVRDAPLPAPDAWVRHSAMQRSRGLYSLINGIWTWINGYTGYTCNHGWCASIPGMNNVVCENSWAGRAGEVKGQDWNCISPDCTDEPTVGQCGNSDYGWYDEGVHCCNDDTWLQYKDIKEDVYHNPENLTRCSDNFFAYRYSLFGCP